MEILRSITPYLLAGALVATFGILIIGILSFAMNRDFNKKYANTLMRARVISQGVAVILFAIMAFAMGTS